METVEFVQMKHGTAEQCRFLHTLETACNRALP